MTKRMAALASSTECWALRLLHRCGSRGGGGFLLKQVDTLFKGGSITS